DVAAPAPRPPVEPRAQVTAIAVGGHAERACVMVAGGGGGVEGADLLVKASGEASVGVADSEPDLTHHLSFQGRRPTAGSRRRRGHGRAGSGLLGQNGTGTEHVEALTLPLV